MTEDERRKIRSGLAAQAVGYMLNTDDSRNDLFARLEGYHMPELAVAATCGKQIMDVVIDLLGRHGLLTEAVAAIEKVAKET